MGIWGIVLIAAVVLFRNRLFPDGGAAETFAPPSLTRLVGRWRRSDGEYILDIKAVHDDGKIDAAYLNPRPIHISKAEAVTKGGHVIVVVTLQDRGYPGNRYTLTYDAETDRLEGMYHHRGHARQFDVKFTRLVETKAKGSMP